MPEPRLSSARSSARPIRMHDFMRIFPVATATVLLLCASPGSAADNSFCQRVATQLGAKPEDVRPMDQGDLATSELKVSLIAGLRAALFGGSAMVSFSVHPVTDDDASEYKRLENACHAISNGVLCKIAGPARIRIASPKGQLAAEATADENVELEVRKSTLFCRDLKTGLKR